MTRLMKIARRGLYARLRSSSTGWGSGRELRNELGKFYGWVCGVSLLCVTTAASATELVYQPLNPSFGGSPLNGSFLLQKAQAQNAHRATEDPKTFVDKFKESLERNLINSITRRIADGELTEGVYDTGEYRIEVGFDTDGAVMVTITSNSTGATTVIKMPAVPGGKL